MMKQRMDAFTRVRGARLYLGGLAVAAGVLHCSSFGSGSWSTIELELPVLRLWALDDIVCDVGR